MLLKVQTTYFNLNNSQKEIIVNSASTLGTSYILPLMHFWCQHPTFLHYLFDLLIFNSSNWFNSDICVFAKLFHASQSLWDTVRNCVISRCCFEHLIMTSQNDASNDVDVYLVIVKINAVTWFVLRSQLCYCKLSRPKKKCWNRRLLLRDLHVNKIKSLNPKHYDNRSNLTTLQIFSIQNWGRGRVPLRYFQNLKGWTNFFYLSK